MNKYDLNVKKLAPRPRSKRRRDTAVRGTQIVNGGSVLGGGSNGSNHTHGNKRHLDRITTDENKYVCLDGEKAKAGFADEAAALTEDSPTRKEFLSRLNDDVAKGNMTFEKAVTILGMAIADNLRTQNYKAGGMTGKGGTMFVDSDGTACIEADKILARSTFSVPVLDVLKEVFSGGNVNITQSGGTIYKVIKMDAAYKLYFLGEADGVAIDDMWHNGDMARCQTLNVQGNGAKAWHRVITAHGVENVDGKRCIYIVVSDNPGIITVTAEDGRSIPDVMGYDTSLPNQAPGEGDKVVHYGSVAEAARQGVLRLDARGNGHGGIYLVQGIGEIKGSIEQFRPTSEPVRITPAGVDISADNISLKGVDVGGKMSEIEATADGIKQKVKNDGQRNLLAGMMELRAKDLTVYKMALGYPEKYRRFESAGYLLSPLNTNSYIDLLKYKNVELLPNTRYVLSFMYVGTVGSTLDFFFLGQQGERIVKNVRNSTTGEISDSIDGNTRITVEKEEWQQGWITFDTVDGNDVLKADFLMGRIVKQVGRNNEAYLCAIKLECGDLPTTWRPADGDTMLQLLYTGIDIAEGIIMMTADNTVFRNNAGEVLAMLNADGTLNAQLINAIQVVTDALNAHTLNVDNAVIDGLKLTGNSQFGPFKVDKEDAMRNTTSTDIYNMMVAMYGIYLRFYDKQGLFKRVEWGLRPSASASVENATHVEILRPSFNVENIVRGQYMKVRKTTEERRMAGYYDDAYYIPVGTVAGLRPRLRTVVASAAGIKNVQLTWEDFTVMLFDADGGGGKKINITLPPADTIQSGQRIEIRACDAIDNAVTADVAISDTGRVEHNNMKVYIYEGVYKKWFVNNF